MNKLISGVKNSKPGILEGFKSYGNPVTGNAFIMFVEEKQLASDTALIEPTWEIVVKDAIPIKHAAELPTLDGYVLAAHSRVEEAIAKVIKITANGQIEWQLDIPEHGELTAISATVKCYFLSGHKMDEFGGIDASYSHVST